MSEVGSIRRLRIGSFVMNVDVLESYLSAVAKIWAVALANLVQFAPPSQ